MPRSRRIMSLTCLTALATGIMVGGCRPSGASQPLHDRDPIFVIPAVAEVAEQSSQQATPEQIRQLVQLLDNDDAAIRLAAIQTLREMNNGEQLGYQFWQTPEQRAEAVQRWHQWAQARSGASQTNRQ